jgi:hypothetical protein
MHRTIAQEAGHRALAGAMIFANYEATGLERLQSELKTDRTRSNS